MMFEATGHDEKNLRKGIGCLVNVYDTAGYNTAHTSA